MEPAFPFPEAADPARASIVTTVTPENSVDLIDQ
jgi:hypothetical protein